MLVAYWGSKDLILLLHPLPVALSTCTHNVRYELKVQLCASFLGCVRAEKCGSCEESQWCVQSWFTLQSHQHWLDFFSGIFVLEGQVQSTNIIFLAYQCKIWRFHVRPELQGVDESSRPISCLVCLSPRTPGSPGLLVLGAGLRAATS